MSAPAGSRAALRSILLGGLLPVVLFTVIEEAYGVVAGLIAGMVFGAGELLFERVRLGRVQPLTWIGNGLLLGLGALSLFTQAGVWFKLQPSILELIFGLALAGSVAMRRPLLVIMAEQQGTLAQAPEARRALIVRWMGAVSLRTGVFFLAHAAVAAWAAFYWSTRAWAILKGVGFTLSFVLYLGAEVLVFRRRIAVRPDQ